MNIPPIANGSVLPDSIKTKLMQDEKEVQEKKESRRHDWMIALFGIIGGTVGGAVSSLIVVCLTK